jgi:hypothetical protein
VATAFSIKSSAGGSFRLSSSFTLRENPQPDIKKREVIRTTKE